MGTLPPNLLSDSMLTGLPVGRFCQMYRDKPLPDLGLGPGVQHQPSGAVGGLVRGHTPHDLG
jgi:hypothetical protein